MTFDIAYHFVFRFMQISQRVLFSVSVIHSKKHKFRLYFEYNSVIELLRELLNKS